MVGQVSPVFGVGLGTARRSLLLSVSPLLVGGERRALRLETCLSSFHLENGQLPEEIKVRVTN